MQQEAGSYIAHHCRQRMAQRYDMELTDLDVTNLKKLLQSKYYVLMVEQPEGRKMVMTRYRGRYIVLVTDYKDRALITALPYLKQDLQFVEQFVKEFN